MGKKILKISKSCDHLPTPYKVVLKSTKYPIVKAKIKTQN